MTKVKRWIQRIVKQHAKIAGGGGSIWREKGAGKNKVHTKERD